MDLRAAVRRPLLAAEPSPLQGIDGNSSSDQPDLLLDLKRQNMSADWDRTGPDRTDESALSKPLQDVQ